ncbi:Peptide deformylase [Rhynchospora pubera]|uniref:Peptide deformylase n=1 Tax=Rhynchospora pubera TaxID=906938 RepID=A0AAV8F7P6_9POAL|nr:Peptide deformylase [Rhynchospora pubera]
MAGRLHQVSSACFSSLLPRLSLSRQSISHLSLDSRRFSSCAKLPLASSCSGSFSTRAWRGDLPFSTKELEFATEDDLRFQSPLKIVEYPDPILRAKNKRINTFDDNLKKLVAEMFDVMYKTDGIGLSAPQVGVNVQLMVFNSAGEPGEGEEMVLINPVIYKASKRITTFNEGCLSFPGIYADVERPATIKVDARDVIGAKFKINLSGLSARVFQHEFDHLKGILFFDRMTTDVLETIDADLKALEEKYEQRTGKQRPESIESYLGTRQVAGFPQV